MSVFLALGFRLLILYIAVRLAWSLFSGRKNTIPPVKNKGGADAGRFDEHGKNVAEGDYEELK
jgi:hypothetical protein